MILTSIYSKLKNKLGKVAIQKIRDVTYSRFFLRDLVWSQWKFGRWDSSWRFKKLPIVNICRGASFQIGRNWVACSDPRHNSLGVFQKVTIKVLSPNASLVIGDYVGMSGVSISCANSISIGSDVLLGSGCAISDTDAHPLHPDDRQDPKFIKSRRVIIGDGVFVGARSLILKGVVIGEGAVVGAGSVVTRDVAPFTIVAGNPAQQVGEVECLSNKV